MKIRRVTRAGRTMEIDEYCINHIPRGPRGKKKESTPERIKKANLRRRTDMLRQLMNANFNDRDFWSLTLTYRKGREPGSIRQVRRDASDFVRRLRKCARLFGVETKFIYCIGAGPHRRHIHITVNALPDMAILAGCWIHGHVSMTKLYSDGQYRDLADYYIKNALETKQQEEELGEDPGQMYVCSRNLTKPTVEKHIITGRSKAEPEAIPGWIIEKDSIYRGLTSMGFPLLRYTLLEVKNETRGAGDKAVYLHGRSGTERRPGESVIHASVHEKRDGRRIPEGSHDGGGKSKGCHTGSHDGRHSQDQRRERNPGIDNMPLPRSDSGHKSASILRLASKWLEKFKRTGDRARR